MIPAYRPRPGRARAVIAVVGENIGVEVSDFLVPFAILSRTGTLDVSAVTLDSGPLSTFTDLGRPRFRIATDTTVAQFDVIHPEGADYIIVPAQAATPRLIAWLKRQSGQGATIVTICNGALVAAQMGTFDGRRATAHWSTAATRGKQYPGIRWLPNRRYVADGNCAINAVNTSQEMRSNSPSPISALTRPTTLASAIHAGAMKGLRGGFSGALMRHPHAARRARSR
ncbi:DJ-1/PfpI family protein [Stenotrophomonas bentonitica]|uniref:DJ-1/PfpI family protein n=1 Tax=Stenotrophomonas bentonitica TaxID=1450134 RepID=UPI0020C260D2|nr:DJ-1/PfpI family protein [Stenotrophomonas bentonitica]